MVQSLDRPQVRSLGSRPFRFRRAERGNPGVLKGRAAISPEMALRIEAWLGVARGGEARLWLAEQSAYDVWQAQQRFKAAPMHVQSAPMAA